MAFSEDFEEYLSYTLLDLQVWQYVAMLLIGVGSKCLRWLFFGIGKRVYQRNEEKLKFFKKLSRYSSLWLSTGIILLFQEDLGLAQSVYLAKMLVVFHLLFSITSLLCVNNLINFLFVVITQRLAGANWDKLGIVHVLKSLVKFSVMSFLGLLLLSLFVDYKLGDWLRMFSIGAGTLTAIVAFASRDFIANFFGALVITIGRPFRIGDWIVINGIAGRVVGLDMRATKLQTVDGTFVYIPNSTFTNKHVQNYGPHTYAQLSLTLLLPETTEEALASFLAQLETLLANAPQLYPAESKYTTEVLGLQKMKLCLYLSFVDSTEKDKVTHMKNFIAQVAALAKKEHITLAE